MLVGSLVIVILTAYWNWFAPRVDGWPTLVADIITILPALAAAVLGTVLLRQYEHGEKARQVWFWFVLGWWAWVAGELTSFGYDLFRIAYGDLSVYDIFWTVGYICFLFSLFLQFRSIYSTHKKSGLAFFFISILLILMVTWGLTQWALKAGLGDDMSWFSLFLAIFYPVCDLVAGVMALWLAFLFVSCAWGRPWWSLIVFAVADGINIFLWIGGNHLLAENTATFFDRLSSTIYNSGYLVAMLGFFFILFINYWPALSKRTDPLSKPA